MSSFVPLVATLAIACAAASPAPVTVTLDREAYAPGDTALVTVTRHGDGPVVFAGYCDLFVEARCDSGWAEVQTPDCSNVRVRPTTLEAGASVELPFVIHAPASPCRPLRLRLRYQEKDDAGYRAVYSFEYELTEQ